MIVLMWEVKVIHPLSQIISSLSLDGKQAHDDNMIRI